MIKTIKLENFKCFELETLQFRNLTVFCGGNASGKSTAIQSLLLLRQSNDSGYFGSGRLQLNGKLFSVGRVRDLVRFGNASREVSITVETERKTAIYRFGYKGGELEGYDLYSQSAIEEDFNFMKQGFTYLNAERVGPRNLYDISSELTHDLDVGVSGEFTAAILEAKGIDQAPNSRLAGKANLMNATKTFMRQIIPGLDISSELIAAADKVVVKFNNTGITQNDVRPINTGFGISYTLPIVVGALLRKEGDMIIVENPEAHLHPRAQSMLGQFLSTVAQSGVQVVVETHSDHVINGLRVFVKDNPSFAPSIIINSLKLEDDGKRSKFEVEIDQDGNLTSAPPSFFDQIRIDLMRLF